MSKKTYSEKKSNKNWDQIIDINKSFEFTEKQKNIAKTILDPNNTITFIDGPAGTSKSFMAVYCGLKLLARGRVNEIIYVRAPIESGKSLGALPGMLHEKFENYTQPLMDKVHELLGKKSAQSLTGTGLSTDIPQIRSIPLNYMQGTNLVNKYIILDEIQNCTVRDILMVVTRMGENSKLVGIGDKMQSYIKDSGWEYFLNIFSDKESVENGINSFEFSASEIVRSGIVRFILMKYNKFHGKDS